MKRLNVDIHYTNCLKPYTLNAEREDDNYNIYNTELKGIFISDLQAGILQNNLSPPPASV